LVEPPTQEEIKAKAKKEGKPEPITND